MINKALVYGIVGFLLGGLLVSVAAVTFEKDNDSYSCKNTQTTTMSHNKNTTHMLANLKGDDFDEAFIEEMIMHHQGAIDMADLTETNAKHEEIKQLGRDIEAAQTKEIEMMQTWQKDWGYQTNTQSHNMNGM